MTLTSGEAADPALWRCVLPTLTVPDLDRATRLGWLKNEDRSFAERQAKADLRIQAAARRILRRLVVAATAGVRPETVSFTTTCPHCGGTNHGAPRVSPPLADEIRISTSSAGEHAVILIGTASLGVDVEACDRGAAIDPERAAVAVPGWRRVLDECPPGATVLEVWTALEALSKTTGRGLLASAAQIERAAEQHQLTWLESEPGIVTCAATWADSPGPVAVSLRF